MGHYSFIKQIIPYSPDIIANTMVDCENAGLKNT